MTHSLPKMHGLGSEDVVFPTDAPDQQFYLPELKLVSPDKPKNQSLFQVVPMNSRKYFFFLADSCSSLFNWVPISQLSYKLLSRLQGNTERLSFILPPDVTLMLFLHLTSFTSLLEHEPCRALHWTRQHLRWKYICRTAPKRLKWKISSFIADVLIYSVPFSISFSINSLNRLIPERMWAEFLLPLHSLPWISVSVA